MGRHREERKRKLNSYWTRNKVDVVIKSGWMRNKVDVFVKSGWISNKVDVQTRYTKAAAVARRSGKITYDDNSKVNDPVKNMANSYLCAKTLDLHNYYKSLYPKERQQEALDTIRQLRYLTLDGLYLGTTTRLAKDCGVPLSNIHVCSDEIEFKGDGRSSKNSYTGQLTDYLRSISREDVIFDVVFLDFCGNLSKNNMEAVELLFKKRLLEAVGIFAITLSYRNGPQASSYNREHSFGGMLRVEEIAKRYGYYIGNTDPVENVSYGMCTYVCKFMEIKNALDHCTGLILDQNNLGPDNWVRRSVPNLPPLFLHSSEQKRMEQKHEDDTIQNHNDQSQKKVMKQESQQNGGVHEEVQIMDLDEEVQIIDLDDDEFCDKDLCDRKGDYKVDKNGKVVFQVGDSVSVRLTGLLTFSGYRHCYMDGKIIAIDDSNFYDLYEVKLKHIDDSIRVHYDRLGKVRGADVNREWKPGDRVQVFEKDGWWEANVLSFDPLSKLYRIQWIGYGTICEVPITKIRKN